LASFRTSFTGNFREARVLGLASDRLEPQPRSHVQAPLNMCGAPALKYTHQRIRVKLGKKVCRDQGPNDVATRGRLLAIER
jgi:hypothetical protein